MAIPSMGDTRQKSHCIEEASSESGIHPAVDDRIVAGVRHGQPVEHKPHILDVFVGPNFRTLITHNDERVKREPTQTESGHTGDHHLHHLMVSKRRNGLTRCIG